MNMVYKESKKILCPCCMKEHEVETVQVKEEALFKNRLFNYYANYQYCNMADELYADETQIQENDIELKNAYRKEEGLLTSDEITSIRMKYGITQSDLCLLLGWGAKTITRYESHQVQDRAHDTILKKIDNDPEWFISLLNEAQDELSEESYQKYLSEASALFMKGEDIYLRKAIEARYAKYRGENLWDGMKKLSLDKVVEMIRYYAASPQVDNLYKVKLMKLMWYADALSFKKRGFAITGLVYQALPMGAVPIAHDSIIDLDGVPCEEVDMGESSAYHFTLKGRQKYKYLKPFDCQILDEVIDKLGKMSRDEIVSFMHKERAYIETEPRGIISFEYAKDLQI